MFVIRRVPTIESDHNKQGAFMWNKILGAIGCIWGGAILVSAFFGGGSAGGSDAYAAGHSVGVIFAALLFIVGGYYLFRKAR